MTSKCGFIAFIGEPNAGKSTLTNALIGAKVSIVTHKVQTTRTRIRGVLTEGETQMIIIDTPGLFKPKRGLDRAMVAAAWAGVGDADLIVLLVEAHKGLTEGVQKILEKLTEKHSFGKKIALAINKIDMVPRDQLLALTQELNQAFTFCKTFMISAEKGYGLGDLKTWMSGEMPEGVWHFPDDQIADLPLRMMAAELTREKLTLRLHQELPYQLTVETEAWTPMKNGSVRVDQIVYVARDGHKGIVLGNKGETIKQISMQSRKELEALIEQKVHLFIQVKTRKNWLNEAERFSEMGLDFSDSK